MEWELKKDIEVRLILFLEKVYLGGIEKICLEDGCLIEVDMLVVMISG